MRCPSCNEEAGLIVGDADFSSLSLVGLVANAEVTQSQFCDKCSATVREDRFRGFVEIPEAVRHLGEAHKPELCPEAVVSTDGEDELEAQFRFNCSCGHETLKHKAIVRLVVEALPWTEPS